LLTHVVDIPYINNTWSLEEFKDELKTEIINSAHAHKERDYVTGSSCVSAPPSDHVGYPSRSFKYISLN